MKRWRQCSANVFREDAARAVVFSRAKALFRYISQLPNNLIFIFHYLEKFQVYCCSIAINLAITSFVFAGMSASAL
jgi:hypothetical protein